MAKFKAKNGARLKVDPQAAGERLEELKAMHGGMIESEHVVEDAAPADSVLHPQFEWDDAKAAHAHRLDQAAYLVRSIVVVRDEALDAGPKEVRLFVSVRPDETGRQCYVGVDDAMARPDWRKQVLADAIRDMEAFKRKYADLSELASVLEAIDETLEAIPA